MMTNGYMTFLDYLELRRRVEKRLTSGNRFLLHILIFGVGATLIGVAGFNALYNPPEYFINPQYGHIVSLWSGVLLAYGLWTYWRSGARGDKRDAVIESEMRERLQNDDLYLNDHPKDLFRLHGLLNDDICKRANLIPTLLLFVFINALIWIPWALSGQAFTSFAWNAASLLVVPFLLAMVWNIWRRGRHESKLRKQLEQLFSREPIEDNYDPEREIRLSDSDELVTVDEYMMKRKRN